MTIFGTSQTAAHSRRRWSPRRALGERLVGLNRYDYNAFFVADGVGEDVLPRVAVESCLTHPTVYPQSAQRLGAHLRLGMDRRLNARKRLLHL
jgi:hypothetical protein